MTSVRSVRTTAGQPPWGEAASQAAVDLFWLPLGAGGSVVRFNGRIYEALRAFLERRRRLDLYHSALEIRVPDGRFVVELTPIPAGDRAERGVVCEGPVGHRRLGRLRVFRYELRCWRDGDIPDIAEAVASPQRLTDDPAAACRLLENLRSVPVVTWGRDELHTGEMWNSNSVISWLLVSSGLPLAQLPARGRAPGWDAGVSVAQREQVSSRIQPAL